MFLATPPAPELAAVVLSLSAAADVADPAVALLFFLVAVVVVEATVVAVPFLSAAASRTTKNIKAQAIVADPDPVGS